MLSWAIIGVIVGLLLGLTGAGGAVIAVPLFVYLADVSIRDATTLSLIAVLAGSLLNWTFQFRNTDYRFSIPLFIFSALGSYLFRPLKDQAPEWLITVLFLAVALGSLIALWKKSPERQPSTAGAVRHRFIKTSTGGLALGGLITLTGLGGGVVLVPFLKGALQLPMNRAAATSLLTILLASIFSLWLQFDTITMTASIGPALALLGGSIAAAVAARQISIHLPPAILNRLRMGLITTVILISVVSLIAKTASSTQGEIGMQPQSIHMTELKDVYTKLGPKEKVLDVRTPEEFAEGHVPGALNIDHESVGRHADELSGYDKVYIHCRSGKRAQIALEELRSKGLKNLILVKDSGMIDWTESGLPEERGKP